MQALAYRKNYKTKDIDVREHSWLSTGTTYPNNDFVVAYSLDGTIASRYGDMTWDFNAYAHGNPDTKLSYTFWCSDVLDDRHHSLIAELKWLNFCNIWKRTDTTLATSTYKLLHLTACRIAGYAYNNNTSIKTLLSDDDSFTRFASSIAPAFSRHIRHLLFSLNLVEPAELGFTLVDMDAQKILIRNAETIVYEQTAPIPTRIYSNLLSCISSQLTETEQYINRLLAISKEIASHPLCGRSLASQRSHWKKRTGKSFDLTGQQLNFETLAQKHNLVEYFRAYDVWNVKLLSGRLSTVQTLCKLAIHAYSGMRDNEVEMLPLGCLVTEKQLGLVHYLIVGKTYKFNSGLGRRAKWVVGEDAARGVRIAQRLSKCALEISGFDLPDENIPDDRYPLFISLLHLKFEHKKVDPKEAKIRRAADLHFRNRKTWIESFVLQITEQDIHELNNMDPFRDWERKSYISGSRWPLKTHQLRRSLALYASRSGLVSLPSLRRQLQHITQEMSLYYAKGSHFAKNFIDDGEATSQRHFSLEVQETASESEMLSFLLNVIDSDERLFGGQGAFWQRQKEKHNINISKVDRDKTLKDFRNGRRSFQSTPLGGCGKVGECNERAMGSFMGCILDDRSASGDPKPCRYSYLTLSRIEEVIVSQEKRIEKEARLGTNNMYYKEISDDLDVLKKYHARISKK